MSHLGRRRSLTVAAVALVALVAPAAAHAATYTVKAGDGPCGGSDTACGGLVEAAAAPAAPGDVFNVSPGTYQGVNFTVGGITINGQAGVLINTTLQFSGAAGGASKVSKVAVTQGAATGTGVLVTGASGLELSDAVVVSKNDHAIFLSASTANKIVRTLAITGGATTSAVHVASETGTPNKALTIESSILAGGLAGLGVTTTAAEIEAAPGDVTITARHITAAGSTNGVRLDATGARRLVGAGVGNIAMTLTNSITISNAALPFTGQLGTNLGANTATITVPPGDKTILSGDKGALFADAKGGNFRLRPGSPAIGQGGVVAGESATDIDGEDRAAPPTDLGGDEFFNAAPIAKIVVKTAAPRATQPVAFDASTSADREANYGGGIVAYQWTFSDGTAETTAGPTITHAFPAEGDASASLVVVDRQGAASAPATVALKLIDGTPPTVAIVKPKNKQKIKLFTTKTTTKTVNGVKTTTKKRTRTKIVFSGLSKDASGVAQVILTLEKLPKSGSSSSTKCNWFDPKRGIVRKSCKRPVLIYAKLKKDDKNGEWSYTVSRNLTRGTYRLSALGVDKTGAVGNAGGTKVGVIRFTLI